MNAGFKKIWYFNYFITVSRIRELSACSFPRRNVNTLPPNPQGNPLTTTSKACTRYWLQLGIALSQKLQWNGWLDCRLAHKVWDGNGCLLVERVE